MSDNGFTKTENALIMLAETFYEYASKGQDGDDTQLDRSEMDMLLNNELKNLMGDSTFDQFDADQSGSVNFAEFMREMAVMGDKVQSKVKSAVQQAKK